MIHDSFMFTDVTSPALSQSHHYCVCLSSCLVVSCCAATPLSPSPGQVVNLTAIQDASSASVTLQWVPPMHNGDLVTSYDVRFKPVGAAHYTYKTVGVLSFKFSLLSK